MQHEAEYRPEGDRESQLIESLEPDQLVAAVAKPLPRLQLSRTVRIALWAVRIFVLIISVLVVYTFIVQLMK
jgi:hypothetical protein